MLLNACLVYRMCLRRPLTDRATTGDTNNKCDDLHISSLMQNITLEEFFRHMKGPMWVQMSALPASWFSEPLLTCPSVQRRCFSR